MSRALLHRLPLPWIDQQRGRRVGELLAVIWILSLVDLFFTLWAHLCTPLREMNPIAAWMLKPGMIPCLVAFKVLVTLAGSIIFWRLRRLPRTELALWGVTLVYVLLLFRWSAYTIVALA